MSSAAQILDFPALSAQRNAAITERRARHLREYTSVAWKPFVAGCVFVAFYAYVMFPLLDAFTVWWTS